MKGHLRLRGERWYVVLDLPRDESGKRRQKWISVPGKKSDAQKQLVRIQHELAQNAYVAPADMTVAEYFDRWLAEYAPARVSAKTLESYTEYLRLHMAPAFGKVKLGKLTPAHVQAYYARALQAGRRRGGPLSARTVLHHHRLLKQVLQRAVRLKYIGSNPADYVDPPRAIGHEPEVFDDTQIVTMLKAAEGTRLFTLVLLAVTTGMRRGELLGLRWKDVDLKQGTASVKQSLSQTRAGMAFKPPKSKNSRRSVKLPAVAVDALQAHQQVQLGEKELLGVGYTDLDLVFCEQDGTPRSPRAVSAAFGDFLQKHGLPAIRFHDLRHTHATLLLKGHIHPKVVSERLGHSTITLTLNTYSHVLPDMQDEAANHIDRALRRNRD